MVDESGRKVTPRMELALVQLLAGATDEEAAKAAGVSRQSVSKWRNHVPAFIAELRSRQAEVFERSIRRLALGLERAAAAIVGLADSKDEEVRLRAAVALFKTYSQAREVEEIEARVVTLEQKLNIGKLSTFTPFQGAGYEADLARQRAVGGGT